MSDKDADLKISADASAAEAELNRLAEQSLTSSQRIQSNFREASLQMQSNMRQATEGIEASFAQLRESAAKLNSVFIAASAVLAGGSIFKGAVDNAVNLQKEVSKLSREMGISQEQALGLHYALNDMFVDDDVMHAAISKLAIQVSEGGKKFEELGIKIKDSSGKTRDMMSIFLDVNSKIKEFKEGTDRDAASVFFYGKKWEEVSKILEISREKIDAGLKKAKDLGIELSKDDVKNYRDNLNDAKDAMEAVSIRIGNALLPALSSMAAYFARIDFSPIIWGFKHLIQFVDETITAINLAWNDTKYVFDQLTTAAGQMGAALSAILTGHFQDAKNIWAEGDAQILKREKEHLSEYFRINKEHADRVASLWKTSKAQQAESGDSGNGNSTWHAPKSDKSSIVSIWKEQLELQLEAEKNYFKDSLQAEIAFWSQKLNLTKAGSKERRAVEHELFTLHKREAQEQLQNEVATLKSQAEAMQAGGVERIRIAGEIAAKVGDKYGLESKEYKVALLEMQKAAQEHQKQLEKLEEMRLERQKQHALNALEIERENLKLQKDLGDITNTQELEGLKALEEKEYEIQVKAAKDKAALIADPVQRQAELDRIEGMAEQHGLKMAKINGDIAKEQKSEWDKLAEPIKSAFDKSVSGIIQGTLTMQKALKNIFQSIAVEFANLGIKMVTQWVFNEARKTAATVLGIQQRNAAESSGTGQSLIMQAGLSIKKIMNAAWETFAGIFAFMSKLVGPAAAPFAMAGMAAVAGVAGSIMFAEQGYDIPAGINPMVQAHQKEMILPAEQADVIRGMAKNQRGAGRGSSDDVGGGFSNNVTVNYHDYSGRVTAEDIAKNSKAIVRAIEKESRNFGFKVQNGKIAT